MRIKQTKKEVIKDVKNNISPSELSKKYNIPIKTIYTWKYRNT
jgi:transposase